MTAARPDGGTAASAAPVPEEIPELEFSVRDAGVVEYAAVPTLRFDLRVEAGPATIRSVSLNAQVRIAAPRRAYDAEERERLFDLFGAPRDWGRNLRGLLWAQTSFVVPGFEGSTEAELALPCSYDFEVAAARYLHALRDGTVPLEFLFSGSVFYAGPGGALRTARLPWDREADFEMPAALWHELMDRYFPNTAWLRLRRDLFDRLLAYRSGRGLSTWEQALEALLPEAGPSGQEAP